MGTAAALKPGRLKQGSVKAGKVAVTRAGRPKPKTAAHSRPKAVEAAVAKPPRVSKTGASSVSRISSKGQITLPLAVRERLGVESGDDVEFFFDGQRTIVKPVRPDENPFEKWVGIAHDPRSPEEILREQRELRGWDAWDFEQYG